MRRCALVIRSMNADRFSAERILLIDDDPAVHEEFRKMLRLEVSAAQPLDLASSALLGRSAPRVNAAPIRNRRRAAGRGRP